MAQHWAKQYHFFNAYGPTEATVCTTIYRYKSLLNNSLPIGRPIANTQIYILDAHLQPVPLGVAGEIYIGGAGVARGYLNRPGLTAERFVADPFGQTEEGTQGGAHPHANNNTGPSARLYKTGDLGRWLPDGTIEFLGRNDFQVKIRGFRIELGEVESQLSKCPGVREAVVIAREDSPGDKRLVAYLLARDNAELSAADLRSQLAAVLADHQLPSAYVTLESFPLTPNGKLDRKALPAPDGASVVSRGYEAPQGPIETAIARIWQELLQLDQVGRHDHFFELGGHSLLAVQLVSRLRQELDVEVPLRDLFAQATLAGFAQIVTTARQAALPPILSADRSQALPLSWAQQRLWFLDQLDPAASVAYHIPAGLRLHGTLDRTALQAALDQIIARHEGLRTTFVSVDGQPSQVIAPASIGFTLLEHDLRGLAPPEQATTVSQFSADEASQPFGLATGPLIRGQLLQLAEDEHILLITQHHIVSDGWSMGILIREFSSLYAAFRLGQPDPLPTLGIQYADYAAWQRQWLQGDTLQAQIDFWQSHLTGAPGLLELPTDRPRPATQSYVGGSVEFTLSTELGAGLKQLAQRHGSTLFMVLLTGWSILMARLSGQGDIVIGTPVANRQRTEVEALIGFFVNTLALRVKMEGDPNVAELLNQVKTTTLGAYAHQDIPFEQVVDIVKPERSLGQSPVFQVMVTMDNTPDTGELSLPGLTLSGLDVPHTTTQFDLSLSLSDTGGRVVGSLEYASELFDRATIERFVSHFQTLLAGIVADGQQRISQLPLLTQPERQRLLISFNGTAVDYPQDRLIHQLFEEQAAHTPAAAALTYGGQSLSYQALNTQANQLAHHLISLGVRPDDRVAICVERSLGMVIGLLGILKAGGAYVPLDPGYPKERLAYMLSDSAPVALLTQAALKGTLEGLSATVPVILLDAQGTSRAHSGTDTGASAGSAFSHCPGHNPDAQALGLQPRHLAYVIYTSGSTGQPKGVIPGPSTPAPGLRHLHLRVHRAAQGGDGRTWQCGSVICRHPRKVQLWCR
jgi:non-ribosomal peptide synthetase component F/acyl carrier protein